MTQIVNGVRVVLAVSILLSTVGILWINLRSHKSYIAQVILLPASRYVQTVDYQTHDVQTTDWLLPTEVYPTTGFMTTLEVDSSDNNYTTFPTTAVLHPKLDNEVDGNLINGLPVGERYACPEHIGADYSCQRYNPDWVNQNDTGKLLESRIQKIRQRCELYHSYLFNTSLSEFGSRRNKPAQGRRRVRVMTNSRLKLGFCWMPKMGSTFWKRAWKVMNYAPSSIPTKHRKHQTGADKLATFFAHEKSKSRESDKYVTYTISRNPWDRLVSVYREKCETNWPKDQCKLKFGDRCRRKVKTFERFLHCVVDSLSKEQSELYGHVEKSYVRCRICDYPYDYVVLMENMVEEKEFLFKQAGVENPRKVMEKVRERTIRKVEAQGKKKSYTDYWKTIPPDLIDKVRFYYRYEIYLFGYPETPFYNV